MYKAAIVLALVAVASAGNIAYAPATYAAPAYLDHHVGSTAEQTVRGGLFGGSVSHQSKTVQGLHSVATSYKNKATNNAVYAAAPVATYAAAPAYTQYAAAPAAYHAAPVAAYSAPVVQKTLLGTAYSPVAPGVATLSFDGFGVHYGY